MVALFAGILGSTALAGDGDPDHLDRSRSLTPPVEPACISSPFGPRHLLAGPLRNAYHNGIDLPAPVGHPVVAVGPGTILRVQRKGPGGLEVLIQHNGFIGVYSHLGLVTPAIASGYRNVRAGQKIGLVGRSGLTFGSHLFFAMLIWNRPVDPAPYLGVPHCDEAKRTPAHVAVRP